MKATLLSVMPLYFCLAWGSSACRGQDYSWDTIAGSPGPGGNADGAKGTARFYNPSCLAVAASGVIYVSDTYNSTIRKLQPSGTDWIVTTIAGVAGMRSFADGTNNDALFNRPNGIVIDPNGTLFVVDHYNHLIRKIVPQDTNYVVSTIAGEVLVPGSQDGATGQSSFRNPTGIDLDSQGNLYVVDTSNFTIRRLSPVPDPWWASTIAGEAGFDGFVDDYNQLAEFESPMCVAVDGTDKVYVTDFGNNAIRQITLNGTDWLTTTIAGNTNAGSSDGSGMVARFLTPNGIAVDASGNLYVADQGNHTIRKVSPSGTDWMVRTIGGMAGLSGAVDGVGSDARFKKPFGITVDSTGVLYVADFSNNTIRRGSPIGGLPTIQLTSSGGQFLLAWPVNAANFEMEMSETPPPSATWQTITQGITVSGDSLTLPMVPNASSGFYRLRQK